MKTIAIISEKGGVSKTTLSINLGVAAALKNKVVAIIDLDPQASSSEWGDLREAETPAIIATPASRLNNVLETAEEEGFDLLILDTAPRAEATVLNAAKAADLILIPCCPSLFDIKALKNTIDLIKLAKKTATFVLTSVPTSGTVGEESAQALKDFEFPLCPIRIYSRIAFKRSLVEGQGVLEYEPRGKAADEISQLYKWVEKQLKKLK
ncbi:ParA family partition ATPase [Tolypothrix sp. VBCCA 56010]|uniref:ParA family partition ATPase n=1 Tax=Tolypothrix sp. VBCCA 56010 TaxID=3137731 RepID=UPI003D7EFC86